MRINDVCELNDFKMSTNSNSKHKGNCSSINRGVIIIFLLVAFLFAFSLSQSSYGKKILSHIPEFSKQKPLIGLK